MLNQFIPDIYLYSDVYKGNDSGKQVNAPIQKEPVTDYLSRSPGYALTLLAESTTGALHCSEAVSKPGAAPEDIALQSTYSLLTEIERGGCIDKLHQPLVLLYMVLGSEDVGRCVMSEPTTRTCDQFLHNF